MTENYPDVVMRAANLERHSLPATLDRPPGKDKLGTAAQVFYFDIRERIRVFFFFHFCSLLGIPVFLLQIPTKRKHGKEGK